MATSFHDLVADDFFQKNSIRKECVTFRELCVSVANGESDFGVMAIENALAGSLLTNHQLINEFDLKIIGESYLRINLHLVSNEKDIANVSTVYSHPVALSQCTDFLYNHPSITPIEKADTAGSAEDIAKNNLKNIGAICSRESAYKWSLNVLAENIEDHYQNCTRFVILASEPSAVQFDKVSVAFSVNNKPGALESILRPISDMSINLTKIQSVPILGKPYEYSIHMDFECGQDELNALESVWENCNYQIMGAYKKGPKPDFDSKIRNLHKIN